MARFNTSINCATGEVTQIPFTQVEEDVQDAREKEWTDGAAAREMDEIRNHRDGLLTETDWMALGDVTMSDA